MIHIQRYSGQRVKDGKTVIGYAAVACESDSAFILIPAKDSDKKFHIVEVTPDSIVPVL
jgi:hypothetical protein